MPSHTTSFEQLIAEAERQPFSGWDFSYLRGRMQEQTTTWDYAGRVRGRLPGVDVLLDMGTGGGEFLAGLAPLPPRTVATEGYAPNVEIARARLEPLGVEVVPIVGAPDNVDIAPGEGRGSLPFPDDSFSLIINRHESYYPAEVYRILRSSGTFITQQVGAEHDQDLVTLLGGPTDPGPAWNLDFAIDQLEQAGFRIVDRREEFPERLFRDIGAVVYYLRAVPWELPGFTVESHRDRLAALHRRIGAEGGLRTHGHFFYIEAAKQ